MVSQSSITMLPVISGVMKLLSHLKILGFSIGVYNKQLVSLDEPKLGFDILVTFIGKESSFPELELISNIS